MPSLPLSCKAVRLPSSICQYTFVFLYCSTAGLLLHLLAHVLIFSVICELLMDRDYIIQNFILSHLPSFSRWATKLYILTGNTCPVSEGLTLIATGSLNFSSCKCFQMLLGLWPERSHSWPVSWGPSPWSSLFSRERRASLRLKFSGKWFLKWLEITRKTGNCQTHCRKEFVK